MPDGTIQVVPPERIEGWRPVRPSERDVAVVICHTGGWADGRLGRVKGPAGPPGWFTVILDDGQKLLARPGEAVTRPT